MPSVQLLIADAEDLTLGTFLTPQWGVYLNGVPVIQPASQLGNIVSAALAPLFSVASLIAPGGSGTLSVGGIIQPVFASTVEFEYGQDFPISTYPQEQGAFQPYDKITLPFDIKLKLACGGPVSVRQAFLNTCLGISQSFSLFDIVTPEKTYTSVNCSHIGWPRSAQRNNTLIAVDLAFKQVPVTSGVDFTNTQQPGNSAPQSLSNVQTQTPNTRVSQAFSAFGGN